MSTTRNGLYIPLIQPTIGWVYDLARLISTNYAQVTRCGTATPLYTVFFDPAQEKSHRLFIVPSKDSAQTGPQPWRGNLFLNLPYVGLSTEHAEFLIDHRDLQFRYVSAARFVDGEELRFDMSSSPHGVPVQRTGVKEATLNVGQNGTINLEISLPSGNEQHPNVRIVIMMVFVLNDPEFYVTAKFNGRVPREHWPKNIEYLLHTLFEGSIIKSWQRHCAETSFGFEEQGFVEVGKLQFLLDFFASIQDFVRQNAYLLRDTFGVVADDFLALNKSRIDQKTGIVPCSEFMRKLLI
jgi:hypothetical protein